MPWTFESSTGKMFDLDGLLLAIGYSGHGPGVNNPVLQNIRKVGPIPEGWYTLGDAVNSSEHGPDAIPLIPDSENEMYGRDDFWEHGDEIAHPGQHLASLGCIIQPRFSRDRQIESPDKRLQVVKIFPIQPEMVTDSEIGK